MARFVSVAKKRWIIVALFTLLGIVLAILDIGRSTKMYSATTQIFVAASSAANASSLNSVNTFAEDRVQSYVSVATSPTVTNYVKKTLGLSLTPTQIGAKIVASAPLNKVLINLKVTDASPQRAADIANAAATQFIKSVEDIETISSATPAGTPVSPVKLSVIHPAQPPSVPISPRKKLILIVGLLGGLLVGVVVVFARERLDTRIHTDDDATDIVDSPMLAIIGLDKKAGSEPIAIRADAYGPRSEAFRLLRTNLQFVDVDNPPRVVAVTSAQPSEGKTSVALNLAASIAEAGQRVCLVEADLRRPRLAAALGLPSGAGLTSVLVGKADLSDVMQDVGHGMSVITAGPLPPNPSELLASRQFHAVIKDLAQRVDLVVIDTAPLLPVADGAEVVSAVDASLLVVRASKTNRESLRAAVGRIERVDGVLAGLVLNMARKQHASSAYGNYSSVAPTPVAEHRISEQKAELSSRA